MEQQHDVLKVLVALGRGLRAAGGWIMRRLDVAFERWRLRGLIEALSPGFGELHLGDVREQDLVLVVRASRGRVKTLTLRPNGREGRWILKLEG